MKKPTVKELEQLKMLKQYNYVLEYLNKLDEHYIDRLQNESDLVQLRQAQGSLYVVKKLKQLISE